MDSQLENKIGLKLAVSAAETWQYALKEIRRLEYNDKRFENWLNYLKNSH